jgi:uncharacterized protein with HEPN domain
MRREELYLTDMVQAADAIAEFIAGLAEDDFLGDELRQSAVQQKLMVIGEAAARLPEPFRNRYPEIEWRKIVAFRNVLVHSYFSIRLPLIWETATGDVPDLRQKIAHVLEQEFGVRL